MVSDPDRPVAGLLETIATGSIRQWVARRLPATPLWADEWDVCCVLDGCRVDLMREVARDGHEALPSPEAVETRWSVGSQSAEWMDRTFGQRYHEEMARTAYLTGNPFTSQPADHILVTSGEVLPLDADAFGLLYEAWRDEWVDDEISTIPPEALTDAAIAMWRRREALDIDRVLVHYMQPHAPFRSRPDLFLGTADVESWGVLEDDNDGKEELDREAIPDEDLEIIDQLSGEDDIVKDVWTRVRDGEIPRSEVWAAYRDNLQWVLDDLTRLLANCDGRITFTSDHGNAAGEFGVWSHPPGTPLPVLRRVPWVDQQGADRGTADPVLPERIRTADPDPEGSDDVDARLAALGYR